MSVNEMVMENGHVVEDMQFLLQPHAIVGTSDCPNVAAERRMIWHSGSESSRSSIQRQSADESGPADDPLLADITLVLAHFAQTLGADGWMLMRWVDRAPPACLAAAGLEQDQIVAVTQTAHRLWPVPRKAPTRPEWIAPPLSTYPAAVLVMPLHPGSDGPSICVTLVFTDVDDDECQQMERVGMAGWPQVAACLRLWQIAEDERQRTAGIEAGLNLIAIGIVQLKSDGHIVFSNRAARSLIDRHDGIREHRGQIQATNRIDANSLSNAIGYALAGSEVGERADRVPLLALTRDKGPPLIASIATVPGRSTRDAGNGALILFVDTSLDICDVAEPVCKLFHLSRVETELACLLASGQTLACAAQSLHIKIGTARGYLKNIFGKTGCNRQVDLVRLIFSNLAGNMDIT